MSEEPKEEELAVIVAAVCAYLEGKDQLQERLQELLQEYVPVPAFKPVKSRWQSFFHPNTEHYFLRLHQRQKISYERW